MMKMKLYRVTPVPEPQFMIVAENTSQAGEIFVTYSAAFGQFRAGKFVIEQYEEKVSDDWNDGLEDMLERGLPGVAMYQDGIGWSLKPPG
jgi:hypothetical protein